MAAALRPGWTGRGVHGTTAAASTTAAAGGLRTVNDSVEQLRQRLLHFAQARDWLQFHSPKNLSCALVVEAGELLEHFQWLSDEQSRALPAPQRAEVAAEMADVFIYLLQLSTAMGVDLLQAAREKIERNEQRYPVALSRGHNRKADRL